MQSVLHSCPSLMCSCEETEGGEEGEGAKEGKGEAAECIWSHRAMVGKAFAEGTGAHGARHARCAAAVGDAFTRQFAGNVTKSTRVDLVYDTRVPRSRWAHMGCRLGSQAVPDQPED